LAAVPQLGRAAGVEPQIAPEAAATQELYERYARQIYGFCLHQLGNREEAEDAVQTTFLNAFRGLRRGISPEAESAWLFKIAHNVCLTRRRSSWRRGRVETPGDMQAVQDFVAAPQRMDTDELIELQEALAGMPANQRKAILLREWRGMSYREIAEEMELSQAAVETLIFRARRSLAKGLEEPEQRGVWQRLRQGMDIGSALAILKTMFAGGAAVKAVATATAVTSVGLVTAVPGGERVVRHATAEKPAAAAKAPAPADAKASAAAPIATNWERPEVASATPTTRRAHGPALKAKRRAAAPAKASSEAPVIPVEDAPAPVVESAPPPQAEQPPAPASTSPAAQSESQRPSHDRPRAEEKRSEHPRSEPARTEPPKSESKRESPKAEAPRSEPNQGPSPKAEQPKGESNRGESPRGDSSKGESNGEGPRSDASKNEIRKLEAPKDVAPKADASPGEGTRAAPPSAPQADSRGAEPKSEGPRFESVRATSSSPSGPERAHEKAEARAEAKAEAAEAKVEAKVETRAEAKVETKAEAKVEAKTESKGEGKSEGKGKKP
jgi:RNA polymerase sigma factor (sigma-70 family)